MITNPWDAPYEPGCYLIHFEQKHKRIQHYKGSADCIADRIEDHEHTICTPPEEGDEDQTWKKKGPGAKLMGVINHLRIDWTLARVWITEDCRTLETNIREYKNNVELCPICSGEKAYGRIPG